MKTILVTGAAGFIGSHLCESLMKQGHTVIGIDDMSLGRWRNIKHLISQENFDLHIGDITKPLILSSIFHEYDITTIFHLAANSDIAAGVLSPEIDFKNTLMTTMSILNATSEFNVKELIFASSSAIYGETTAVLTEDFGPLVPVSHYGAAKLASEAFINSYAQACGFKVYICRFPNVCGEHATHGVMLDLINKLKKDHSSLEVLGDGEQVKPYIYVRELVDAIVFIWGNAVEKINVFNIGVTSRTSVKFIAESIVKAMGYSKDIIKYKGGDRGWVGDIPQFSLSTEKLAQLGWSPTLSSNEAVELSIKRML